MSAFENNSGKVNSAVFKEELLPFSGALRKEVLCGPKFGVDTSIIDLKNGLAMAVCSDPLSLIPSLGMKASAWLSVHLPANDMATTGYAPKYAQVVLNLPTSLSRKDFAEYWQHIHQQCEQLGIAITGGHTGQVEGQNSTISGGGTMFLTAPKESLLSSNNAQSGDAIIVSKSAALSSTAILAMAFPETVKEKLGAEIQQKAANNFWSISVLKEAMIAAKTLIPNKEIHAMHDVTEGGVLGAISEMAQASDCGFSVNNDSLPIHQEVQEVADLFEIDPRFSIGAGSMIMSVKPGNEERLISTLKAENIEATVVGHFTERDKGQQLIENGEEKTFSFNGTDPYWEAFFKAFNAGWK
ncbi:hydrogenase maturation factor [Owenweeksia hongkongensis DSM 17368]|uniref:Hydrogenase maturation factor n=1 Tax=Owenweeksia hongkongensis (strain DSM 17368 / CIP 108786 / JCM 12287 / NRRL B-23963 / UST20020801) TaxID=926562 RepID=G8R4D4_OWEHD|nr:AIR synthase family protein [Owenweeksia hongkongensis]AEV34234.1 hydrogenase maturation factor [Owenweeksia hongkongensis DSM 17368]